MKRRRKPLRYLAVTLLLLLAFCLAGYPFISNWWVENSADSVVAALDAATEEAGTEEPSAETEAARKYNEALAGVRVNLTDPFNASAMGDGNPEYESLLCMTEDGIMGYIQIPSINVNLPIFHGTSGTVLEQGVGHLEGTSLPVGGESTHTVLTGHTGLSGAKLFTDLTELAEGDIFFLNVFGERMAYKVGQITVVEPDDLDSLYIVDGKDYCTLVTCTPYGINSHRLLVRGERTDYEEAVSDENTYKPREQTSAWMREYRESLYTSLAVFLFFLLLYLLIRKLSNGKKTGAQAQTAKKGEENRNTPRKGKGEEL